jgi:hypothetical protein
VPYPITPHIYSDDFRRMLGPCLAGLLDEAKPLKPLRDFLDSYERHLITMPLTSGRTAHQRDVFLLRMLMSNPLPVEYFARLTFRTDMTGGLHLKGGAWRIRTTSGLGDDLRSRLHRGSYDEPVDAALAANVEAYLCDVRPRLFRAEELPAVFLPSERCSVVNSRSLKNALKDGVWNTFLMEQSLMRTLRQAWPALHRVHPEQIRHLAAAAHLKANDRDSLTRITHRHVPPGLTRNR